MSKLERVWQAVEAEVVRNKGYLQPGFTASDIADKYDFSTRDISAVIKLRRGGNFSTYLQHYRVKAARQMFAQEANADKSCEYIGRKCGFANRQSMHNAFRRQTGMTALEYRQKYYKKSENN